MWHVGPPSTLRWAWRGLNGGKDWPSGVEGGEETDHVLGTSSLIPDSRAELFLYGLAYESARPGVKGMLLAPKDRSQHSTHPHLPLKLGPGQ